MAPREGPRQKKGGRKINIGGVTTERVRNDETMRKLRDAYGAQQFE